MRIVSETEFVGEIFLMRLIFSSLEYIKRLILELYGSPDYCLHPQRMKDSEYNVLKLQITCKSVFFIMQHLHYLSSGNFIPTKRELLECVQGEDKIVLELSISLQDHIDYDRAFLILFNWCQNALDYD